MGFEIPVRVYIEDTDAGGIVFYGNYLRFFERARTDFLRSIGIEQSSTIENNMIFVVRHMSVDYKLPARLDDVLSVSCAVKTIRQTRIIFTQSATRSADGVNLVNGEVEVVAVSVDTLKPRALPEKLLNALQMTVESTDV
ncbi:MAG TPA: tol-pal system-associated acyl-CoA thioesterase [Gammaproteobacteria bacterium]|nr:tol-pal system-associated acyl-CoA thioesterase [Gammaproteobacteria bacterium]